MQAEREDSERIAFGRFSIFPRQRRMLGGNEPIELGARAFDLLLALAESPGTVISRDTLISRVWESRIVSEDNLRVQISALRSALGADRGLIQTVNGRGYRFSGELRPSQAMGRAPTGPGDAFEPPASVRTNLPEPISDLIGRDADLQDVLALTGSHRLVTLTGAGGIGKTRLASEAARLLVPQFPDGVWVAELSTLCDPKLVPAAVAAAVGLDLAEDQPSADRVAGVLGIKELLIVLDTCEHVIDAAAEIAEALLRAGANVHVIATSRETLNAEGEWVYRVRPLSVPTADLTDPLGYRAVSLFVARARATDRDFSTEEYAVQTIATICRRLDGNPLAIELAAARSATLGIYTLADRLDDHLQLLTCGKRTALPRHQTMRATLDWSYELLTDTERAVLRRLAVFCGVFGLDEVRAVIADGDITTMDAIEALANLVAKSVVTTEVDAGITCFRLLATTRAYALEKLAASDDFEVTAHRWIEYDRNRLERTEAEGDTYPSSNLLPDRAKLSLRFAA